MKLGIDVDGVLADFNTNFINLIIKVAGEDKFPPRPFDIPVWDYPQFFGYSKEVTNRAWREIEESEDFWFTLPELEGASDFLGWLAQVNEFHDLYFITSRMGRRVKQQTECWLQLHGWQGDITPTVLISSAKGGCAAALKLDAYLDDKVENISDVRCEAPNCAAYLYTQPWNVGTVAAKHASSLAEFQFQAQFERLL